MKIHFIGIGGIGVSALAQYYLQKGHEVSGSDLVASEITDALAIKGIKIMIGQAAENIASDIEIVIHSPAVPATNPEYKQAKDLGIKLFSYPDALGQLTKDYTTIAVSGSHGKSTTTAMIGLLLVKAGIDPTVIVGTKLKEFGNSNFKMGDSKYLVIEACEYDGSFLNYSPFITVITNIDKEHMDYFKTFANVLKTFKNFIMRLPTDGFLVANKDDSHVTKLAKFLAKKSVVFYSVKQREAGKLKKALKVPGMHNVSNALAALQVARLLGVKDAVSLKALGEYEGSWRRFEMKESVVDGRNITVVSDYGHHPNEAAATLKAAREKFGKRKIFLIFQPHQYQRTFYLFKDFVKLFKAAKVNEIVITDIYDVAGREVGNINAKVSSELLVKKIGKKHIQYLPTSAAELFVKQNVSNGDVVIIMGAGDIYKLFEKF